MAEPTGQKRLVGILKSNKLGQITPAKLVIKRPTSPGASQVAEKQSKSKAIDKSSATKDLPPSQSKKPLQIREAIFSMKKFDAEKDLPIVYSRKYNMSLLGLQWLHHFDTQKYQKLATYLNDDFRDTPFVREKQADDFNVSDDDEDDVTGDAKTNKKRRVPSRKLRFLRPNRRVTLRELAIHHSDSYLAQIHNSKSLIATISELWLINLLPLCCIERRILAPLKLQVSGTIFAAHLAMQHGWSINLGGGFHQSSRDGGETFCLFSDIGVTIKYIWRKHPLQKFMIIDLDAHQATGLERDLCQLDAKKRQMVFMVDIFNRTIHPADEEADKGVDLRRDLGRFVGDKTYLGVLDKTLAAAFEKFKPNLIFYVAGQDVLYDDPLGLMNLSDEGLIKRDELVFRYATERNKCAIVMLLGGGYLTRGAQVQADSIRNLFELGLIWGGVRSGSRSLSRPKKSEMLATKYSGMSRAFVPQLSGFHR